MKYATQDENGFLYITEVIDDSFEKVDDAIEIGDIIFDDSNEYYIENGVLKFRKRIVNLTEFEKTQKALNAALERQEFLEDCLAELINEVYSE